jgi:hypothetical protein
VTWPRRRLRLVLIAGLLAGVPAQARAEVPLSADWRLVFDYLVQDVCVGPSGAAQAGVSPLEGPGSCPRQRDLEIGERLPYHKHDWADGGARAALPDGYQRSDSVPIRAPRLGVAVVQSFDFGAPPNRFGSIDPGDGGQIAIFSPASVSYGVTEDGGDGLQLFLGPDCTAPGAVDRLRDSWVIVARGFTPDRPGETVARLTKWPDRCPGALGYAFTRWHVQSLRLRIATAGRTGHHDFATLISDHFGGRDPERANHLERFYFTRELGLVRWERWENLARPGDPMARADADARAAALAASDRCDAVAAAPAATGRWLMIDCRQWTRIVAPRDPAGDAPGFWIDALKANPIAAPLFAD